MARRHVVLGGSEGMGFAYAMHYAREGDCLTLVARRQWRLAEARAALLDAGAAAVTTIPNDLLDHSFRIRLWEERNSYDSILAGGLPLQQAISTTSTVQKSFHTKLLAQRCFSSPVSYSPHFLLG